MLSKFYHIFTILKDAFVGESPQLAKESFQFYITQIPY